MEPLYGTDQDAHSARGMRTPHASSCAPPGMEEWRSPVYTPCIAMYNPPTYLISQGKIVGKEDDLREKRDHEVQEEEKRGHRH